MDTPADIVSQTMDCPDAIDDASSLRTERTMMSTMRALLVICLYLCASTSHAQQPDTDSGNYRLRGCKDAISTATTNVPNTDRMSAYQSGLCMGTAKTLGEIGRVKFQGVPWCTPADATTGQIIGVIVKYLEDNPQMLNQNFMFLAMLALSKAWPCTK
jgi:hypothetical protein